MPTYEYECQKCGKRFDFFQKMNDEPLSICPEESCKGAVKRLLSAGAGFIFKGSGFYATDYRKPDKKDKKTQKDKDSCSKCEQAPSCPNANK